MAGTLPALFGLQVSQHLDSTETIGLYARCLTPARLAKVNPALLPGSAANYNKTTAIDLIQA
jgi:hypothetical protein